MNCSNNNCSSAGLDLIGLSSSIAILISQNFELEDLGILAALFTTIGDNLALIATSRAACEAQKAINNSEESLDLNISDSNFTNQF